MYSKVKENVQGHFDFHFLCFAFNYFSNKRYSVFAECTANIYIGVQLEYKFVVFKFQWLLPTRECVSTGAAGA